MTEQERQTRWRLILGAESQPDFAQMGAAPLSQEELLIDSGQQPAREYPTLPEEVKLAKMMQRARRREQKKRLKQQTAEAATSRRGLRRR